MPPLPLDPQQAAMPSHATLEQAAHWFALLRSGDASATDHAQWQIWLDAAPSHRTAWLYIERISGRFNAIQTYPERQAAAKGYCTANAHMARRRQTIAGLGMLVGSSLLGWASWHHTPLRSMVLAWSADFSTATGEVHDAVLPDGSRIWLGTASAFDLDYGNTLRRLRLVAGEILVQTAADPQRPFVVDTPQGRLRALGTRFSVRLEGNTTHLAIYQGAVEARTADSGIEHIAQAGQQLRFTNQDMGATQAADPIREAWTRGILITDNTPLIDVVRELQRYRTGHLGVAPEIANLPVVGSYPATDPDRALSMLASVLPIRIKRTLPWWISIEPDTSAPR